MKKNPAPAESGKDWIWACPRFRGVGLSAASVNALQDVG